MKHMYSARSVPAMTISRQGAKRGIDWQGALSDVCPIVDEPVEQVATAANARAESLSTSDLPSQRRSKHRGRNERKDQGQGFMFYRDICLPQSSVGS